MCAIPFKLAVTTLRTAAASPASVERYHRYFNVESFNKKPFQLYVWVFSAGFPGLSFSVKMFVSYPKIHIIARGMFGSGMFPDLMSCLPFFYMKRIAPKLKTGLNLSQSLN